MNLMHTKNNPGRLARVLATSAMLMATAGVVAISTGFAAAQEHVYKVGEDGTLPPKVLHKTEPEYSESARDAKINGTTVLTLEISKTGEAENIGVLQSLEASLDQKAIESIRQWKFAPATKMGEPVRVKATIEVNFRLK